MHGDFRPSGRGRKDVERFSAADPDGAGVRDVVRSTRRRSGHCRLRARVPHDAAGRRRGPRDRCRWGNPPVLATVPRMGRDSPKIAGRGSSPLGGTPRPHEHGITHPGSGAMSWVSAVPRLYSEAASSWSGRPSHRAGAVAAAVRGAPGRSCRAAPRSRRRSSARRAPPRAAPARCTARAGTCPPQSRPPRRRR